MPLIGTAGHVDHGKSTLIERLTGLDPDRWDEEKQRGLTIDLGFAWTTLPSGSEVSFVDVPGHERYMKNMLAGIEAIDVAVLVVAADESWMPQTEEHVAVLDLLGVSNGVVALTKADIVDADLIELATLEIGERLEGTTLEDSPIVPVSAIEGDGIERLVAEIDRAVIALPEPLFNRPRMWIDRAFPIAGAGTVITGSLLRGRLETDQSLEIYPNGTAVRVRGIQAHERDLSIVEPRRRVAVNLAGVEHQDVKRGHMLGQPGQWDTTSRFLVSLRRPRFVDDLSQKGAYTIHVGSSAQPAAITGMSSTHAMVTVEHPLPLTAGDKFILRDTGRRLVVGGGVVIDVAPGSTRSALRFAETLDNNITADGLALALLRQRGQDSLKTLERHTNGGIPEGAFVVGDLALDPEVADNMRSRAENLVSAAHSEYPLRPGLALATLSERLRTTPEIAEEIVATTALTRHGPYVAQPSFEPKPSSDQLEAWASAQDRLRYRLAVPRESELDLDAEMVAHLIRTEDLVRVAPDLVFLPSQLHELTAAAKSLEDDFTVAQFRDATALTRKYAVPILEWMDKEGLTVRRGETRSFR